jgi:HK97 family phage prohead protease
MLTRASDRVTSKRYAELGAIDVPSRSVRVLASTSNPVDGEALESWDLTRFAKNPVILWNHNLDPASSTVPIGRAEDIESTPHGLSMRIVFASARANPFAEQIWQGIQEKMIRGISVGFDPGADRTEDVEGKPVTVRSANMLCEVSVVPVPKDEDALTAPAEIHPSDAARALARKRYAVTPAPAEADARADAADVFDRFDTSLLGKVKRSPSGGIRVPARLTRTGVLDYRMPDGSIRRELRLPAEVFAADSIETLEGAPVVPKVFHRAMVTPETWKQASLGHASGMKADGKFLAGELFVNDAAAIDKIERGELKELSCGYSCSLEFTPGTWNGQRYDAIQRGIRYNHVALLAPNEGRAGPEVSLRLDSKDAICAIGDDMKTIRLDGKDYEVGSQEHLDALDGIHKRELDAVQVKLDAASKELEQTKARFDAASDKLKKLEEDNGEEKMTKRVRARVRLFTRAMEFLKGEEDEEKDEKMDALTDREIQERVILKVNPNFDAKDRSDAYIEARFDAICEDSQTEAGVNGARAKIQTAIKIDAKDKSAGDETDKARAARDERNRNAWKTPLSAHKA